MTRKTNTATGARNREMGLEVTWRQPLPERLDGQPLRAGEIIIARTGNLVTGLGAGGGEVLWEHRLADRFSPGQTAASETGIATSHSLGAGFTALRFLGLDGIERWRAETNGQVLRDGLWFESDQLWVLASSGGAVLRAFDAGDGRQLREIVTPGFATSEVLSHPRGQLLRSSSDRIDVAGLALLAAGAAGEAEPLQRLREGRTWAFSEADGRLVLTRGGDFRRCELECLDLETLETIWLRGGFASPAVALPREGEHPVEVEGAAIAAFPLDEGGAARPALLDADGGSLWAGEPCASEAIDIFPNGTVLLVRELFESVAYDLSRGTLLGRSEDTFTPPVRWRDRLILGQGEDLVCLAIPGAG